MSTIPVAATGRAVRLYAHRGASAEAPENTLEAFARALEAGAEALREEAEREPAPPLETAREDLPPLLSHIVTRCLEKERDRRYQSLADVRLEIEAVESGTGRLPQLAPVRRRRWMPWAAAAAIVVIAAVVIPPASPLRGEDGSLTESPFLTGIAAIVAKLAGAFVVPGWASIVVVVIPKRGNRLSRIHRHDPNAARPATTWSP